MCLKGIYLQQNLNPMTMGSIKLLLFDLDGTIVNSMYDIGDAMNHTYRHFGKKEIPYTDIPAMVGGGIRQLLEDAFGADADIDAMHKIFYDFYSSHYVDKTRPYPQVEETLRQLNSLQKGVYSNKPHRFTLGIIDTLALKKYFDFVQGARPELYASKPSPEGILYAIKELGATPKETLFIGDSTHDILAGKAAGTKTCAVTYGYRSREVLMEKKPDFIIDNFEEIIDLIEK